MRRLVWSSLSACETSSGRGYRSNLGCTTENAFYSTLKVWQSKSVKKRIDEGVYGDENKMEISQPVNQLTAACTAEIHEIDHDARWDVTGQKDSEHDQVGFGELVFHLYGSLTSLVQLCLAVSQIVDLGDLVFGVLENTHVRENEYKDGTEHCNVGKDKSVGHKANKEENGGETERKGPHQRGSYTHSLITGVSSVPQRLGDGEVAINSESCQTQQRCRAAQEIHRLGEP